MIDFSDFHTNDALNDTAVGISIQELIKGSEQGAYASVIEAGNKVGCHCHHEGEEWYIILSGDGVISTADVKDGSLGPVSRTVFKKGSVFRIPSGTAHQLVALSKVSLIFLCPSSHLEHDRMVFESIC